MSKLGRRDLGEIDRAELGMVAGDLDVLTTPEQLARELGTATTWLDAVSDTRPDIGHVTDLA